MLIRLGRSIARATIPLTSAASRPNRRGATCSRPEVGFPRHMTRPRRVADDIEVVGVGSPGLNDIYHGLIRAPWAATLLVIVGAYLVINLVFAGLYALTGGIDGAHGF